MSDSIVIMALAARQSQMFRGNNGVNVGRTVDTVVNERTGVAAQRERVIAAVPDEHGNVIVMMQERIRTVRVVSSLLSQCYIIRHSYLCCL